MLPGLRVLRTKLGASIVVWSLAGAALLCSCGLPYFYGSVLAVCGGTIAAVVLNFNSIRNKIRAIWAVVSVATTSFEDQDVVQRIVTMAGKDDAATPTPPTSIGSKGVSDSGSSRGVSQSCSSSSGTSREAAAAIATCPPEFAGLVLLEKAGQGAFGKVFRCQDSQGKECAIKVIDWSLTCGDDKQRMAREVEVMQSFNHSRLVSCHRTASVFDGTIRQTWILQEWCDGGSLYQHCSSPRPRAEVADMCVDICQGCAHLHDRRIIHADLTPSNVLLQSAAGGFICKICDFGLSRVLDEERMYLMVSRIGTVSHMAPELLDPDACRHKLSNKADVYSIGMLLYHMLLGQAPWMGLSTLQVVVAVSRGRLPSLTGRGVDVDEDVVGIFEDCISVDAARRPQCRELEARFRAL